MANINNNCVRTLNPAQAFNADASVLDIPMIWATSKPNEIVADLKKAASEEPMPEFKSPDFGSAAERASQTATVAREAQFRGAVYKAYLIGAVNYAATLGEFTEANQEKFNALYAELLRVCIEELKVPVGNECEPSIEGAKAMAQLLHVGILPVFGPAILNKAFEGETVPCDKLTVGGMGSYFEDIPWTSGSAPSIAPPKDSTGNMFRQLFQRSGH